MKTLNKKKILEKAFGARAAKPKRERVGGYIPTDQEFEEERLAIMQEKVAKATEILGFNPFGITAQLTQWQKGCAWHGKDLRKKLVKAGFNLPMLIAHLEAMVTRLKSSH